MPSDGHEKAADVQGTVRKRPPTQGAVKGRGGAKGREAEEADTRGKGDAKKEAEKSKADARKQAEATKADAKKVAAKEKAEARKEAARKRPTTRRSRAKKKKKTTRRRSNFTCRPRQAPRARGFSFRSMTPLSTNRRQHALVRLQRIPGATTNTLLPSWRGQPRGLGEGPAALSMILAPSAAARSQPGDTLIEATSGNTGIASRWSRRCALSHGAGHAGEPVGGTAPDDGRLRRAIRAHPAEGRHGARARHRRAHARSGRGHHPRPVRQPRQSARALHRHGPGDLARHAREGHALRRHHGHYRHDHGLLALLQGEEPGDPGDRRAAQGRRAGPGHPQMARSLPAEDLRAPARRPRDRGEPGGERGDDPAPGARGGDIRRHLVRRRARGAKSEGAERAIVTVHVVCDRGDRYLSTGVFPAS